MIIISNLREAKLGSKVVLTGLGLSQLLLIVLSKVLEFASSGEGDGGDGGGSEEGSECEDYLSHCSSIVVISISQLNTRGWFPKPATSYSLASLVNCCYSHPHDW